MDLVIARGELALVIVDQAAVAHLVRARRLQRHRSADEPDAVPTRRRRQELLDRTCAGLLARLDLVVVAHAHDGEILRQRNQPRSLRRRHFDQAPGLVEVALDVGARGELHGGDTRNPGLFFLLGRVRPGLTERGARRIHGSLTTRHSSLVTRHSGLTTSSRIGSASFSPPRKEMRPASTASAVSHERSSSAARSPSWPAAWCTTSREPGCARQAFTACLIAGCARLVPPLPGRSHNSGGTTKVCAAAATAAAHHPAPRRNLITRIVPRLPARPAAASGASPPGRTSSRSRRIRR